jgi:hypothetical protein
MSPERRYLSVIFAMIISLGMFGGEACAGVITSGPVLQQIDNRSATSQVSELRSLEKLLLQNDSLQWFIRDLREMVVGILALHSSPESGIGLVSISSQVSPTAITNKPFVGLDICLISERYVPNYRGVLPQGVMTDLMRPPEV